MLSLEERADLLVRVAELHRAAAFEEIIAALAGCSEEDLCSELDLGYSLTAAYHRTGQFVAARRLNELLLVHSRARSVDRLYRMHLILKGVLRVESGDLFEAESAFNEAMAHATRAADHSVIADVMMNLGVLAWIGCRWEGALTSFERALAAYSALGRSYMVAGCHQNMGMTYREMQRWADADAHFEAAYQLFSASSSDRSYELSCVEAERALLVHRLGDEERAEAMARRAVARVSNSGAPHRRGDALRVLGIALTSQGRLDEAKSALEEAYQLAQLSGGRLLEAEVCEELFNLESCADSSETARQYAGEAIRLYNAMGAFARERGMLARSRVLSGR